MFWVPPSEEGTQEIQRQGRDALVELATKARTADFHSVSEALTSSSSSSAPQRVGLLVNAPTFRPTMSPTTAPSGFPTSIPTAAPTSIPTAATYIADEFATSSILFLCAMGVLQPVITVTILNLWIW